MRKAISLLSLRSSSSATVTASTFSSCCILPTPATRCLMPCRAAIQHTSLPPVSSYLPQRNGWSMSVRCLSSASSSSSSSSSSPSSSFSLSSNPSAVVDYELPESNRMIHYALRKYAIGVGLCLDVISNAEARNELIKKMADVRDENGKALSPEDALNAVFTSAAENSVEILALLKQSAAAYSLRDLTILRNVFFTQYAALALPPMKAVAHKFFEHWKSELEKKANESNVQETPKIVRFERIPTQTDASLNESERRQELTDSFYRWNYSLFGGQLEVDALGIMNAKHIQQQKEHRDAMAQGYFLQSGKVFDNCICNSPTERAWSKAIFTTEKAFLGVFVNNDYIDTTHRLSEVVLHELLHVWHLTTWHPQPAGFEVDMHDQHYCDKSKLLEEAIRAAGQKDLNILRPSVPPQFSPKLDEKQAILASAVMDNFASELTVEERLQFQRTAKTGVDTATMLHGIGVSPERVKKIMEPMTDPTFYERYQKANAEEKKARRAAEKAKAGL